MPRAFGLKRGGKHPSGRQNSALILNEIVCGGKRQQLLSPLVEQSAQIASRCWLGIAVEVLGLWSG